MQTRINSISDATQLQAIQNIYLCVWIFLCVSVTERRPSFSCRFSNQHHDSYRTTCIYIMYTHTHTHTHIYIYIYMEIIMSSQLTNNGVMIMPLSRQNDNNVFDVIMTLSLHYCDKTTLQCHWRNNVICQLTWRCLVIMMIFRPLHFIHKQSFHGIEHWSPSTITRTVDIWTWSIHSWFHCCLTIIMLLPFAIYVQESPEKSNRKRLNDWCCRCPDDQSPEYLELCSLINENKTNVNSTQTVDGS